MLADVKRFAVDEGDNGRFQGGLQPTEAHRGPGIIFSRAMNYTQSGPKLETGRTTS